MDLTTRKLLFSRLQDGLSLLEAEERAMAAEALELAELHLAQEKFESLQRATLVRLGQLSELLGRRRAQAMPYASIARALIAAHHGDLRTQDQMLADANLKLSMSGL